MLGHRPHSRKSHQLVSRFIKLFVSHNWRSPINRPICFVIRPAAAAAKFIRSFLPASMIAVGGTSFHSGPSKQQLHFHAPWTLSATRRAVVAMNNRKQQHHYHHHVNQPSSWKWPDHHQQPSIRRHQQHPSPLPLSLLLLLRSLPPINCLYNTRCRFRLQRNRRHHHPMPNLTIMWALEEEERTAMQQELQQASREDLLCSIR